MSNTHISEGQEQFIYVDEHSSFPVIARKTFEKVHLIELIDPEGRAESYYGKEKWGTEKEKQYDLVLAWFHESGDSAARKIRTRNSVQDKILATSTSRCNVFKVYLRRKQADTNFALGSATTISGILGAVAGGITSPRNFAAAAGLFSGIQAEFNQTYYSNLAAHVIIQGVELRQKRLNEELMQYRRGRDTESYTIEAAIKDAVFIDGNCSVVAGLIEAQESIQQVDNPGLQIATRAMINAKAMRLVSEGDIISMQKDGTLQSLLSATSGVPSLTVSSTYPSPESNTITNLNDARETPNRLNNLIKSQALELKLEYAKALEKDINPKRKYESSDIARYYANHFKNELDSEMLPTGQLYKCLNALTEPEKEYIKIKSEKSLTQNQIEKIEKETEMEKLSAQINGLLHKTAIIANQFSLNLIEGAQEMRNTWKASGGPIDLESTKLVKLTRDVPPGLCR